MEEREAPTINPILMETLHRKFEEVVRKMWMKRGCTHAAYEALIGKNESGSYKHGELNNAFIVFGEGVVVGMDIVSKKGAI